MRSTLLVVSTSIVFGHTLGCATSDPSTAVTDAAATSKGGKSGSGGASSGGSSASAGGASPGGASASTGGKSPLDCPADSGTESCRQCLAANCCDAYAGCVRDDMCGTALEAYRQCANAAVSNSEKGQCFATFGRTMKDAGASSDLGAALGQCVYQHCSTCGASFI